jgi:hypothetical protein
MSTMNFLPFLRDYLTRNRKIYTARNHGEYALAVDVPGIGLCNCERIGPIHTKEDLIDYWQRSGFGSLDIWWSMVLKLAKNGPYYLYCVTLEDA